MERVKFGIPVFPGSNCDHDCYHAVKKVLGFDAAFLWHGERDLGGCDCIILPGGFSYGDYLRCGAIARFSPIMSSIRGFALSGGLVIGICNGFQILLEAGLLPGAMMMNRDLKFICREVHLKVEDNATPFTLLYRKGEVISIPIAHAAGNYYRPEAEGEEVRAVFRYCGEEGEVTGEFNPNGSIDNIAGIRNGEGNILGLMPHPERRCEEIVGGRDGERIFLSIALWKGGKREGEERAPGLKGG